VKCRDINELRTLLTRQDLERHVVRLRFDMAISSEETRSNASSRPSGNRRYAGVLLLVDRTNSTAARSDGIFPDDLPPVVRTRSRA
jgi:hypothetical protein